MIFSHAPFGFITAYIASKICKNKITKKQTFWLFLIGTITAVFPDFDLFYYYLISTNFTHREMITHTPFLYLTIFLIIFLAGSLLKRPFLKYVSVIILLSSFSHLLLDSIGSGVSWLYPVSDLLYGLLNISYLENGFYGENLFVINFSLELLILLSFLNILLSYKYKERVRRVIFFTISVLFFIVFVISLVFANKHMFYKKASNYYGDLDSDNQMNTRDVDMDGDGEINILDKDANDNGKNNLDDIVQTAERMEGVWYDMTEKKYWNMLSRFGFLTNMDVILKSYDFAGIFLGREIKEDYKEESSDYIGDPSKVSFQNNPYNLYIYCMHKDLLVDAQDLSVGDIILFENETINHASLLVEEPNIIMDGGTDSKIVRTNIEKIKNKVGNNLYYCQILK